MKLTPEEIDHIVKNISDEPNVIVHSWLLNFRDEVCHLIESGAKAQLQKLRQDRERVLDTLKKHLDTIYYDDNGKQYNAWMIPLSLMDVIADEITGGKYGLEYIGEADLPEIQDNITEDSIKLMKKAEELRFGANSGGEHD